MNDSAKVQQMMFALFRTAVCGVPLPTLGAQSLSDQMLAQLYGLAKRHDMAHLIGYVLAEHNLAPQENAYFGKFHQQQMTAVYRYVQIQSELEGLCAALEAAEIPFLPLKGSVLRRYYPEPWMRTSCDIDVLVRKQDLERATACLVEQRSYRNENKSSHDVSLYSPGEVHIELHYDLIEDRMARKPAAVLKRVWSHVSVRNGYRYWNEMNDEMFYFYHVAHMAKHFENGGCGIRPLLDLWILNHKVEHDGEKRDTLLTEGGLLTFAHAAARLSEVWFGQAEHTALTGEMEQYILYGGVYGNTKNRVAVQQNRKGGKLGYLWSRVFLPYDSLKFRYPKLQKHKWMFPFCQVLRWLSLLRRDAAKRTMHEFSTMQGMSKQEVEDTASMLKELGL